MGRRRIDGRALKPLRTLCELGVVGNWSDGQLLDKFLDGTPTQAELAFEEIVERHGLMVRDVCRAILGDPHEAQDVFQATFLVLARRAWTIRHADSVGPWLFGVARKLSMRAKAHNARRRVVEQQGAERNKEARSGPEEAAEAAESQAIVHEEIAHLPERYREVIVLCDLERLSHEHAALRLNCPVETLRTRLTRGRARLRDRLIRRGLAPTIGLVAVSASTPTASAWISPTLASSTARAALAYRTLSTASASTVSATAAALADGLIRSTLMTKLSIPATGFLAVFTVGTGVGVGVLSEPVPAEPGSKPPPLSAPSDAQAEGPSRVPTIGAEEELPIGSVGARSEVIGQTRIIGILEEGTKVVKDQLVAELDTAALRDQLVNQRIATERARADFDNARKTYEVAVINVQEYEKGVFPDELKSVEGAIKLAQSEVVRALERLDEAEKQTGNRLARKAAEFELLQARLDLEQAQLKKRILMEYTREKQLKSLQGDVEKARADMLATESSFNLEAEKEERLGRMIEKCKLWAPIDGVVHYVHPSSPDDDPIAEGAKVREGQVIFAIVPEAE